MFYNYSNLPDVSAEFTRETYRLLTNFAGLKLQSGYSSDSDAVLIGVIRSPEKMAETLRWNSIRVAKNAAPSAVGDRPDFYIPGTSDVSLILQVVVIKKPTEEDLALLRSGIGEQLRGSAKIVYNEYIPIYQRFTREILDDAGNDVIATQNAGVQRKTVKGMADQAATSIRDMILYAF